MNRIVHRELVAPLGAREPRTVGIFRFESPQATASHAYPSAYPAELPPKNAWMPRDRALSPRREPEVAVIASYAKTIYQAMPKAA